MIEEIRGHRLRSDTLGGLIEQTMENDPHRVFGRFGDFELTLAELDRMSRRVAASLRRDGVERGDRVAAFMYPSPWHLALLFACARSGFVWCPINVVLAREDLAYTVGDLRPSLIVADEELRESWERAARELPTSIRDTAVAWHRGYGEGSSPPFNDGWLEEGLEGGEDTAIRLDFDDALAVIYSGGTTGRPKGIEVSQFYPVSAALRMQEMARFHDREVFFSTLQFSHAWTPLTVLPFCLYFGHVFGFWRWWSASKFVSTVRDYDATIVDPYIGMVATLLRTPERRDDADIPARMCISGLGGDEATSKRIRREFERRFGLSTLQMYALTEVGPLACVEFEDEVQRFGSSGKTRGWYQMQVADEDGLGLPQGEIGEILVRPSYPGIMARGYINRESETLETWRDLWVHTGDLGRFDSDGYLYFVGRQGHFIRRRGELVAVDEVEDTLMTMEGIAEVAVVGVPSDLGEEDVKAFVVPDSREHISPREVVRYCSERLAYFKVPTYVEFIDEMPRSASKQEIEKYQLRSMPIGDPVSSTERDHQ